MDVLNPNAEQYTHDARRYSTEGISVSHRVTESTEIHREIRIDFLRRFLRTTHRGFFKPTATNITPLRGVAIPVWREG